MKGNQSQSGHENRISLGRHENQCSICPHAQRQAIEQEWIGWGNTSRIAKTYHVSRDSIYRHARAHGLFSKRARNIKQALERIIEQSETVEVTAAAVVAAVQAYAKINSSGQWVERTEVANLNELFQRMTKEELDAYAKNGTVPDWLVAESGATPEDSQGGQDGS